MARVQSESRSYHPYESRRDSEAVAAHLKKAARAAYLHFCFRTPTSCEAAGSRLAGGSRAHESHACSLLLRLPASTSVHLFESRLPSSAARHHKGCNAVSQPPDSLYSIFSPLPVIPDHVVLRLASVYLV